MTSYPKIRLGDLFYFGTEPASGAHETKGQFIDAGEVQLCQRNPNNLHMTLFAESVWSSTPVWYKLVQTQTVIDIKQNQTVNGQGQLSHHKQSVFQLQ